MLLKVCAVGLGYSFYCFRIHADIEYRNLYTIGPTVYMNFLALSISAFFHYHFNQTDNSHQSRTPLLTLLPVAICSLGQKLRDHLVFL